MCCPVKAYGTGPENKNRKVYLLLLAISLPIGLVVGLTGGAALAQDKSRVTLGRPVPSEILDPPWLALPRRPR